MKHHLKVAVAASLSLFAAASFAQETDLRSYRLGATASWSEAISVGVKELALSSPATPAEMDALIEEAKMIAARFGISVYRETDLLVTDLFPEDVAVGKHGTGHCVDGARDVIVMDAAAVAFAHGAAVDG